MDDLSIQVSGLGKRYRLGSRQPYKALRDVLAGLPARLLGRGGGAAKDEHMWALRDVSFDVKSGEAIGIIGRNGSGKSTLLKILSRITEPSAGRALVRGRVASLLEVGTGFHPELSGRENIFVNGSILGMTRREITAKFDQIVDFSGVEEFIDTPVKRYSSGMRVRLAFAVAAHLDPEILLVDEVLAVGDADFQRKCLGRMNDVTAQGRTVLFVSHQMDAVLGLCSRALWLDRGQVKADGPSAEVVRDYLSHSLSMTGQELAGRTDRQGSGIIRITGLQIRSAHGNAETAMCGDDTEIVFDFENSEPGKNFGTVVLNFALRDSMDRHLATMTTAHGQLEMARLPASGSLVCRMPELPLMPGLYTIDFALRLNNEVSDKVLRAVSFSVSEGSFNGSSHIIRNDALFLIRHGWSLSEATAASTAP